MQEFSTAAAAAAVRRGSTSEAAKVMGFERSTLIIYALIIAILMVRFKYSSYSIHNNPSRFLSLGARLV
jgi:hypothetical protein